MKKAAVWQVRQPQSELVGEICSALGIRRVTAQVLVGRGIDSIPAARQTLALAEQVAHSPWQMPDMRKAVDRLLNALREKERITVYGDYDVDGQTATALVVTVLRRLGAVVDFYIPSRKDEGYGLNAQAVQEIAATGSTLLVTVDCGTTAADEVALAQSLGIDCLVTDHHEPAGELAPAYALINPKLPESTYPWPQLAGVGVAYKLMSALAESLERSELADELIDLVAVGTVADVVPLLDENRLLVYLGLQKLNRKPLPGLAALAAASSLSPGSIESYNVAFHMAPRLNAGGRISHATSGVEMLLAKNMEEALPRAERLDQENRARQAIEEKILEQAKELAAQQQGAPVLVVAGEAWHPGVIGIVASRLVELYGRPACVLTCEGGVATASCRSISGFNLIAALEKNASLFVRYGGHAMAAGFTIAVDRISALRQALCAAANEEFGGELPPPILDIDAWVDLTELDRDLLEELNRLGPFGHGNQAPVLAAKAVTPKYVKTVGKDGNVLRLTLPVGRSQITAVGFRLGHLAPQLQGAQDLAFMLTLNEWQGQQSLELRLRDVRPGDVSVVDSVTDSVADIEAEISLGRSQIAAASAVTDNSRLGSKLDINAQMTPSRTLCFDAAPFVNSKAAYVQGLLQRDLQPYIWVRDEAVMQALAGEFVNFGTKAALPTFIWPEKSLPDPTRSSLHAAATPGHAPWCLVFCSPPTGVAWRRHLTHMAKAWPCPTEAHLLYGQEQKEAALQASTADWPDRDALVLVYRELQRLVASDQDHAVRQLAGLTGLSQDGVWLALQIFSELHIVDPMRKWTLLPRPGSKLDLKVSVSYNDSIMHRQEDGSLLAEKVPQTLLEKMLSVWVGNPR